jgi:hypothetical protein
MQKPTDPKHQPHCWHFIESLSRGNGLAFAPTILSVGLSKSVRSERGLVCAGVRRRGLMHRRGCLCSFVTHYV